MNSKELNLKVQSVESEISRLRRENEVMSAKIDGFEMAMIMLHSKPAEKHSQGMGIDPIWDLKRFIDAEIKGG